MARRKTYKTFVPITSKNSASGDGTTVAGGCVYFSFHRNWSKFGISVCLAPKKNRKKISQLLKFEHFNTFKYLKGPKHEIFESVFFTYIRGLWSGDFGTGEKN